MSQVVVTRDAGGKYLSAVRHSFPSGTNHRGVTRLGRRLLVTGSIEYTVKLASAASRRRRKFKTVHAQRPDQIPPRPFHASPVVPAEAGTQKKQSTPSSPLPRWERARVRVKEARSVATAGDAPRTPPSFPQHRSPSPARRERARVRVKPQRKQSTPPRAPCAQPRGRLPKQQNPIPNIPAIPQIPIQTDATLT